MSKKYLEINNLSSNGSLFISSKVIKDIAVDCINKTDGVTLFDENREKNKKKSEEFDINKKIYISYDKDGRAELFINLNLKKGFNINETCVKLQKDISDILFTMLEQVPIKIMIKVEKII